MGSFYEFTVRLAAVEQKLNILESQVQTLMEEAKKITTETDMEGEKERARGLLIELYAARRALYGYAMILNSMGLSKDQKEAIRQIESLLNSILRASQAITVLNLMLSATTPWGFAAYGILAGGMLAASLAYGSRSLGGG
jgi:hypothetical protein